GLLQHAAMLADYTRLAYHLLSPEQREEVDIEAQAEAAKYLLQRVEAHLTNSASQPPVGHATIDSAVGTLQSGLPFYLANPCDINAQALALDMARVNRIMEEYAEGWTTSQDQRRTGER